MLLSMLLGYKGGCAGVDLFVIRFISNDFFVGVEIDWMRSVQIHFHV